MQLILMFLMHIIECLQMANTLLLIIAVLLAANLILTHTNIKTWLAKAKWGIKEVLMALDRKLIAFVDNRK